MDMLRYCMQLIRAMVAQPSDVGCDMYADLTCCGRGWAGSLSYDSRGVLRDGLAAPVDHNSRFESHSGGGEVHVVARILLV